MFPEESLGPDNLFLAGGYKVAVIVNDMASLNVDAKLVERSDAHFTQVEVSLSSRSGSIVFFYFCSSRFLGAFGEHAEWMYLVSKSSRRGVG
jgi:hypothetical protein